MLTPSRQGSHLMRSGLVPGRRRPTRRYCGPRCLQQFGRHIKYQAHRFARSSVQHSHFRRLQQFQVRLAQLRIQLPPRVRSRSVRPAPEEVSRQNSLSIAESLFQTRTRPRPPRAANRRPALLQSQSTAIAPATPPVVANEILRAPAAPARSAVPRSCRLRQTSEYPQAATYCSRHSAAKGSGCCKSDAA